MTKRGARISVFEEGKLIVRGMVLRPPSRRYVYDQFTARVIDATDDVALLQAIRDALAGRMPPHRLERA